MRKRLLAMTLALCIIFIMSPITALASEGGEEEPAPSADIVQVSSVEDLKSAIKEENAEKTIEITTDLTITEEITVNQPVTITSAENVTITVRNDGTTFVLSNGATLSKLNLEMATINTAEANIVSMQDGTTVTGCIFTGQFNGGGEVSRGIVSVNGEITITNNTFKNLRQPAYIDDGNSGTISNNYVDGTRGWVICSNSSMNITGNTFGENAVDIAIIKNPTTNENKYAGKTVELSKENGNAFVEDQLDHVRAEDGQIQVSVPAAADSDKGYTLQAAIDAASEGDTIVLAPGTYQESITINKAITVTGQAGRAKETIIEGLATVGQTVQLGSGATLSNVTVTRAGNDSTSWNGNSNTTGVLFLQSLTADTTLENCIITHNRNGIYLNNTGKGEGHAVIEGNQIIENRTGINMCNNVNDTVIKDNNISDNSTLGIVYYESTDEGTDLSTVSLTGNIISGNWYGGINLKTLTTKTTGNLEVGDNDFRSSTEVEVSYQAASEPGYDAQIPTWAGGTASAPATPAADVILTLPAESGNKYANLVDYGGLAVKNIDTDSTITVSTGEELLNAVNNAKPGDVIELSGDIEVDEEVYLLNTDNLTIDGNGHTITASSAFQTNSSGQINLMKVEADNVTLKDLKLVTTTANKHALDVYAAKGLVLENVALDHTNAQSGAPLINNGSEIAVRGDFTVITGTNSWYGINIDDKNGTPRLIFEDGVDVTFTDKSGKGLLLIGVEVKNESAGDVVVNPGNAGLVYDPATGQYAPAPPKPEEPGDDNNNSSSSSSSVRRYNIEADAGRGGEISPDGRVRVRRGENQTFRITADDGYEIYDVEVDGKSVGAVSRYTFENVREDHTISATFRRTDVEPETPALPFTDVAEGAWYYDAVAYCYENGILEGTSSVSFAPNMLLNRAMAAQVLYNLADGTASTAAGFPDVAATAWYADAVNWAAAQGYVTGYDNGNFGPEDNLTREQLAVILYRYAGSPEPTGSLNGFVDAASASDYAVDALRWAVGEGLLTGKDGGRLDPTGTASRAELAQILARFAV